jgi:hypothetical protein
MPIGDSQLAEQSTPATPPDLVEALTLHGMALSRIEQRAVRLRSLCASNHITPVKFRGEICRLVQTVREANDVLVTRLIEAPELGS